MRKRDFFHGSRFGGEHERLPAYLKLFFHLSLSLLPYTKNTLDRAVREYQKTSKNPRLFIVLFAHTRENTTNVCLENRTILASFLFASNIEILTFGCTYFSIILDTLKNNIFLRFTTEISYFVHFL